MTTNKRSEFILLMLSSLLLSAILLAVILQGRTIEIVDFPLITLIVDDQSFPLFLGIIPLRIFLLVGALLCLLLITELFGQRAAIFLSLSGALTLCFVWSLLLGIPFLPTPRGQMIWDAAYNTLFGIDFPVFASTASQIFLGFSVTAIVFELFRRLTHNSFLIIRLFMATLVGVACPPILEAFFDGLYQGSKGSILALLLTRYTQWFVLFVFLIPLYYILYFPLKIIAGRKQSLDMCRRFEKKKIFQPPEKVFMESRQELQEKRI